MLLCAASKDGPVASDDGRCCAASKNGPVANDDGYCCAACEDGHAAASDDGDTAARLRVRMDTLLQIRKVTQLQGRTGCK